MAVQHYQLYLENHKIAFSVRLNDILVTTNQRHGACTDEFPVNQFVLNGTNTVEVTLWINPLWVEQLKEQSFSLSISEHAGEMGDLVATEQFAINWHWDDSVAFPLTLTGQFQLSVPYGEWCWKDADILDEHTIDQESLKDYIATLYHCFEQKNYTTLSGLLREKATDLARAFYIPVEERLAEQERFFKEELFSDVNWGLQPYAWDELMWDFHANGRMVHVLRKNGRSPIWSQELQDNYYELELFLCHKNNQWILCR